MELRKQSGKGRGGVEGEEGGGEREGRRRGGRVEGERGKGEEVGNMCRIREGLR